MKKFFTNSLIAVCIAGVATSTFYLAKKFLHIEISKKAYSQTPPAARTPEKANEKAIEKVDGKSIDKAPEKKDLAEKLDAPTDMPIPKELLNEQPNAKVDSALPPLPPPDQQLPQLPQLPSQMPEQMPTQQSGQMPQIAPLPPPSINDDLPPLEIKAGKSPQEIDPTMKFLNNEGFVYDPTGRRDPFRSFIVIKQDTTQPGVIYSGPDQPTSTIPDYLVRDKGPSDTLEGNDVTTFKLVGILWDVNDPKAMVRSPSSKVFMVRRKTRIGRNNGYVAAIREGEIVVIELTNDAKTPTTRVLTLQK